MDNGVGDFEEPAWLFNCQEWRVLRQGHQFTDKIL